MTKSEYAIDAKGIELSFGQLKVLKGINLRAKRGTILALLGPNGAGKTTMVRILATLLKADGGTARIEGFEVKEQADHVREVIGLTGQYTAIDEYLTGRENLQMIGRLYHLSKTDAAKRSEELLKQFDLIDAADRATKTYSGGMGRRLDLAASLIATPPVLFLDEPTTGLDPRSRLVMWDIIKGLVKSGSTILLTTQYLDEADQLADQIAVLDGGKIIAEGTADELKNKVGKERIELTFKDKSELDKAKAVVKDKSMHVNEGNLSLSIANTGGVHKLRTLLAKLEDNKLKVDGLSLHKPTLDDVFLKLTGHVAEETQQNDEKQKTKKGNK